MKNGTSHQNQLIFFGLRAQAMNKRALKSAQWLVLFILAIVEFSSLSFAQGEKTWSKGKITTAEDAAEISFALEPASVQPGGKAKLTIEIAPQGNWYLYEWSSTGEPKNPGYKPVLVHLEAQKVLKVTGPTPSIEPEPKMLIDGSMANVYKKPLSFVYEIHVPENQAEGDIELTGAVAVQACDQSCLLPEGYNFRIKVPVTKTPTSVASEAEWIKGNYNKIKAQIKAAATGNNNTETKSPTKSESPAVIPPKENPPSTDQKSPPANDVKLDVVGGEVNSLALALCFALLGGIVLNLMPCVLPVIGLKVLSFVEQAGKDRRQIFMLNLVYSLGIISVFIVLAAFSAAVGLSWGSQSQKPWFNITMMAIIFSMALSFLGVWEIPIPGFATTPGISRSTQRTGYEGAFLKGIITTLLATPCSGPMLGTVFALTAKLPALQIFLIYFTVGLGMALPYLIIGAFPSSIKFLPKAGAWMDTFKNLMGFMLLGTVIWLFTLIQSVYYIPTLILLFSLWFAFWMIGRVPIYESVRNRLKPWLIGGPIAAIISVAGFWFYLYYENPNELKWKPYSAAALNQATGQGKTVLLDLTADWCATCKWNLFWSINQYEVKQLVNQYDVVALKADFSKDSEENDHLLKVQLQSSSIPILAIYPANSPKNPIVLRDVVQMQDVLDALKKAGPSKPTSGTVIPTSVQN